MNETIEAKANRAMSYLWHWWINSLPPDGPAGDPHKRGLYGFKSMLESLGYFESYLRQAFTAALPQVHQQCSRQAPEVIEKPNRVVCGLGKCVTECPILISLRDKFTEDHSRHYKDVSGDVLYTLMAQTCAWHMQTATLLDDKYVDWNEGAMQDESDRMFWSRTYASLSHSEET